MANPKKCSNGRFYYNWKLKITGDTSSDKVYSRLMDNGTYQAESNPFRTDCLVSKDNGFYLANSNSVGVYGSDAGYDLYSYLQDKQQWLRTTNTRANGIEQFLKNPDTGNYDAPYRTNIHPAISPLPQTKLKQAKAYRGTIAAGILIFTAVALIATLGALGGTHNL